MAWKLGQDSFHKLIVEFVDGNKRTRYSIDWRHENSKTRDKEIGMKRLYNEMAKWGTRAKVVKIYENVYGTKEGQLLEMFKYGVKVQLKNKY